MDPSNSGNVAALANPIALMRSLKNLLEAGDQI